MRISRLLLVQSDTRLQRVWEEATIRVAREDEHGVVCGLMAANEKVHEGVRDTASPRSWLARITGRHRFCFLLEHDHVPLAYLLVSVSPVVASSIDGIFLDKWDKHEGVASEELGNWSRCNFYSVTALNKEPSHPFHGVQVGFPCISKGASYLLKHGARETLKQKAASGKRIAMIVRLIEC
jgi:hypothetical protein